MIYLNIVRAENDLKPKPDVLRINHIYVALTEYFFLIC